MAAGGGGHPVQMYLGEGSHLVYSTNCDAFSDDLREAVNSKDYVPPILDASLWAGREPPAQLAEMPEEKFARALDQGQVRFALIQGRGGLGKSALVVAIQSRLCRFTPAFVVEGHEVLRAKRRWKEGAPGEALIRLVASKVAADEDTDPSESLKALMSRETFVLLVDALDEVGLEDRPVVAEEVLGLRETYPETSRVAVFARAPVFTSNYGLRDLDSRLRLRPLDAAKSEERVRALVDKPADVERFWTFAKATGIGRTAQARGRSVYPLLTTHRDLQVAASLAKNASFDAASEVLGEGFAGTRARMYERHVWAMLKTAYTPIPASPDEAMALADRMVSAKHPSVATRNFEFTRPECLAAASGHGDKAAAVCEAFLVSNLFARIETLDRWRFADRSLMDLFLARWANRKLKKGEGVDCERISRLSGMFESHELSSFLVGLPNGNRCVRQIVQALCDNGCPVADSVELLDEGLPSGEARTALLKGEEDPAATSAPAGEPVGCFDRVLLGLGIGH